MERFAEYARIGGVFISSGERWPLAVVFALLFRRAVGRTQSNEKMMDETGRQQDRQEKCAINDRRLLTSHSSSCVVRRDLTPDNTQLEVCHKLLHRQHKLGLEREQEQVTL